MVYLHFDDIESLLLATVNHGPGFPGRRWRRRW
jgi:hypothetical protein